MGATIMYTIGHSTHPLEEFIDILKANGVELLNDVRTVAGSRHNPQFGGAELAESMPAAGIEYRHVKELGGLRYTPAGQVSVNAAWRNKSFRNYADYMQTTEFAHAVEELVETAATQVVAVMCAEAVPWRCHRSLTRFARTEGTRVWYPPEEDPQEADDGGTRPR